MYQNPISLKLVQFEMICSIRTDRNKRTKTAYATVLTCLKMEVIMNKLSKTFMSQRNSKNPTFTLVFSNKLIAKYGS